MLRSGGLIAGYVIHSPMGLPEADRRRIADLTAMDVAADGTPEELFARAGFSVTACEDLTAEYRDTAAAIVAARAQFETELRAADGEEMFEEEQARKRNAIVGIDEGLLQRSLIAARKP